MAKAYPMNGHGDVLIEARIGIFLRLGVLISATVISFGATLFLLHDGRSIPDYSAFHGVPPDLRTLRGITAGAFNANDLAIIQFGLLLLIATPVARVVLSVCVFLAERDYLYFTISLCVLLVLVHSLIWR
jgi:uncharacterized membrane protein